MPSDRKFIAISGGRDHTCGITTDNEVICRGSDRFGQRSPPRITPLAADPIVISAMISDEDRKQIALSDNGRVVIPVGSARAILTVAARDDEVSEPEVGYTIDLSVEGNAALEHDEVIMTVPVDSRDTLALGDFDKTDNIVAENSPVGVAVGITVRAASSATYTLSDDAGGLFAIDSQSGIVTVAMETLDYEAFSTHNITVQAGNDVNSRNVFTIQITDEPEPIKPVADIDLSPNKIAFGSTPGDTVGITARAIDPDRGNAVSYSLSENANGLFAIGRQDGVVTLASDSYQPNQDYSIEVTARSDDGTSSAAQFTVRRDEPIRIASSPTAPTLREGESRDIIFSFIKTDLELMGISAGDRHSCAVTSDNRAVCWGRNSDGQSSPPSGEKFIAVSAGEGYSCGITPDNDAVCWGGDSQNQGSPPSGRKFIAISASTFDTCAITLDNDALCWGGLFGISLTPPQERKFIAVSAGIASGCGITADNEAICWGDDNFKQSSPPSNRKYIAISAGNTHSCGITLDNRAVCWGSNSDRQTAPIPDERYIAISAGGRHSCAVASDNRAVCWGRNSDGQSSPPSGEKFIAISAGDTHSCAITPDNEAVCWGASEEGQTTPTQVAPISADPVTIAPTLSEEGKRQISVSAQAVIPAGSTQAALTVAVRDDDISEPESDHAIGISATGHTDLEADVIVVTVPADSGDTEFVGDIDQRRNEVAENSPAGAEVGITAYAAGFSDYTLTDSAGGLFAIGSQSGIVTVAMETLDYEAFSTHNITVQAGDADNNLIVSFAIQLSDVAEPIRRITDIDFNPNEIALGAMPGAPVGITATAIDPDRGSTVTYSLSDDAGGLFAIGSQDGVVTLASDSHQPDQDYSIEVTAMSDDGTSSAARFTIRPDEPVLIMYAPEALTIREGESQSRRLLPVTEIDLQG